jgi:autophagy-related protein 101
MYVWWEGEEKGVSMGDRDKPFTPLFVCGSGFLHTILFNRALGSLKPKEADCDIFEITYVSPRFLALEPSKELVVTHLPVCVQASCDDAAIQKTVEEKADLFDAALSKAPNKSAVPLSPAPLLSPSLLSCLSLVVLLAKTCVLSFFEEVSKARWAGLSSAKEKVYWEQWNLPIHLVSPGGGSGVSTTPGASAAASGAGATDKKDSKSKTGLLCFPSLHFGTVVHPPLTSLCAAGDRERRTAARAAAVRERLFTVLTWINEKKDHIPPFKKGTAVCYPYDITFTSDPTGSGDNSDSNWAMNMLKRVVQAGPPMLMKNQ